MIASLQSSNLKSRPMKKTFLTLFAMSVLTLAYGQEIIKGKPVKPSDSARAVAPNEVITLMSKHLIINNRLDLEADSAQYDSDKKILTSFGTRRFTFNGKVVVGKEKGVCKFYLGADAPSTAVLVE